LGDDYSEAFRMAANDRRVKVSRRRFLVGAGATAAVLTAGGAAAGIVLHERESETAATNAITLDVLPTADAGPNPLDDPDTRLRHLLRRTSFVAAPADVQRYRGTPVDKVVDDLLSQDAIDDSAVDKTIAGFNFDTQKQPDVIGTWITRLMHTQRPVVERMTLFWHGLLTSGLAKSGKDHGALLTQNQFFRDHAFDKFDVLLKGVVRDPAMMLWLDIQTSRKGHPNENYARELMELFTLGAGNYTEQDVQESARAHTGYSLDQNKGYLFRPALHDAGSKTFLGQTGNFDADGVVDIILRQEIAPQHFARKLFEFFAYPGPDPQVLTPIATVARESGYDTKRVVRALLTSDAFYSREAYRAIVKSPADFSIGALRLFESQVDPRTVVAAMRSMGQVLLDPPNVAGWPGGRTWLGTSTWFARVNTAAKLMNSGIFGAGAGASAPKVVAAKIDALFLALPASADDAVDQAVRGLVDGRISDDARATLRAYMDEGGGYGSLTRATKDLRMRGLATLVLSSPEYQLA
jgi:uncharacterized protein (DUF1800 family)